MYMTNEEICRSYRLAKNKRNQISVLAELNLCTTSQIKEILKAGQEMIATGPKSNVDKKIDNSIDEKLLRIEHGARVQGAKELVVLMSDKVGAGPIDMADVLVCLRMIERRYEND